MTREQAEQQATHWLLTHVVDRLVSPVEQSYEAGIVRAYLLRLFQDDFIALLLSTQAACLEEAAKQVLDYAQRDVPPSDPVDVMFEDFCTLLAENFRGQAAQGRQP